jgi:hypothetical protein
MRAAGSNCRRSDFHQTDLVGPARMKSTMAGLVGIVALAAIVRLVPILGTDFPLNDGALFLSMANAIRDGGYGLPAFVNYNGAELPFAYPPLGLYLTAAVSTVSGLPGTDVLRFLPLIFSIAAIPVAILMYRSLFATNATALIATAAFALIPRSYNWAIAGGGITRAPGLFLALISIWAAARMFRSEQPKWPRVAGVAAGLAGLCHPESGVFAGLSIGVLAVATGGEWRHRARLTLMAWAVALLIVVPWLALILSRHGLQPLVGALLTGGAIAEGAFRLVTFRYGEGYLEILSVVGAIGLILCLRNRQWLLPLWTAAIFLAGSRASLTYASLPVAGAAAVALLEIGRLIRIGLQSRLQRAVLGRLLATLLGAFLVACTVDSVASAWRPDSPLRALSPDTRIGLAWIAQHTAPTSSFLVAAGEPWPVDAVSEWFPLVAGRRSVATVQGTEWEGPGAYVESRNRQAWLLGCSTTRPVLDCVDEWSRVIGPVDMLVLARGRTETSAGEPCCRELADEAVAEGGDLLFANSELAVIAIRPTISNQ